MTVMTVEVKGTTQQLFYTTNILLYSHAFGFPQYFFNNAEMREFSLISIYMQDPSPSFLIVCKQKPIRVSGVSQCPLLME